jgi:hypothetical protein
MNGFRHPIHRLGLQHGHGPGREADMHTHADEVDYEYEPFPEGDVTTPPACWDQHPSRSETHRFFDRIARWGDQETLQLQGSVLGPLTVRESSKQLVMYETKKPYGVRVTMNATDPSLTAPVAAYIVIWTALVGCGSAMRKYSFIQQVQRSDFQALGSDIILDVSAEVVRVTGVAQFTAAYAPQVGTPTLQAMCAPQVYLPDEEVGPRNVRNRVIR